MEMPLGVLPAGAAGVGDSTGDDPAGVRVRGGDRRKVAPSSIRDAPSKTISVRRMHAPVNLTDMWHVFERGDKHFFNKIHMADDGGFSEVRAMFTPDRFFWAGLALMCLILNLLVIIPTNLDVLLKKGRNAIVDEDASSRFLVANFIIGTALDNNRRLAPDVLLAGLELILLAFHISRCAWVCMKYCRGDRITRWHCVAAVVWEIVPDLSSFSAMRTLHYVTPQVMVPAFTRHVKCAFYSGKYHRPLTYMAFTLCCGVVGLEAFMIKFMMAAERHRSAESFAEALLIAAAFLNQMIGVVDVNKTVKKRLFTFIFGGEDGFVSEYEMCVAKTWMAMLAMHTWEASKERWPSHLWFWAVTLAYGDLDFQRLTLNEAVARRQCNDEEAAKAVDGD